MELQTWIVLIIELIGTVAFSVSGAMVGMRKQMDIFGVIVLGVVTAVGGGMMRDVFLGRIPGAFTKPVYVEAAVVSAVIPFVLLYVNKKLLHSRYQMVYTKIIFLMDSLGLGIFTAMGVSTGVAAGYEKNMFSLLPRNADRCWRWSAADMMAGVPPYIFVKSMSMPVHRLPGRLQCTGLPSVWADSVLITGTAVTLLIRLAAAHYRWNLPCVKLEGGTSSINEPGTDKAEKDMPMINK